VSTALTPKEHQHLTELHSRFQIGTFSETDVSALLILLREKSNGGAIMELANSIAHAERNSGEFFKRIKANQSLLNDLGKRAGTLDARYMFTDASFASSLTDTLKRHGFDQFDRDVADLIFLCGLSLLQGSSVKGGATYGQIHIGLTSEHFELRAQMPIQHNGKTVQAAFPLAAVANKWIPICNPRASLQPNAPVIIKVESFKPLISGFAPFEVHIERAPSISDNDLASLIRLIPRLSRSPEGLEFTPKLGPSMSLRYDGERLTVQGLPDYFRPGSEYELALMSMNFCLGACVHDDSGAHWFLNGLDKAPDGFVCHWVGKGSPTCTRPS
jgi:hypothetical protein